MKLRQFALVAALITAALVNIPFNSYSQPCLPGWKYRMEIDVQNENGSLQYHQVKLEIRTDNLVADGKMQDDGGDIRFMDSDNTLLSYWIQPGTFNSPETIIWIKAEELPAGSSTIYMYYGNMDAVHGSSGDATFPFFDDFSGGLGDWNLCCGDAYLSGEKLKLSATGENNYKTLLKTGEPLPDASYVANMYVSELQGGDNKQISIGQFDSDNNGYGFTSDETGANDEMIISEFTEASSACFDYTDLHGPATVDYDYTGVWGFLWTSSNSLRGWQRNENIELGTPADTHNYPSSVYTGIQIYGGSGTATIDWFLARKWAEQDITLNAKSETLMPDAGNLNAGSNSPLCEGEELHLFADDISSADYEWKEPNGQELSNDVNVTIPNADHPYNDGVYQLTVTPYSGSCDKIIEDVQVEVSPASDAGNITGETSVCAGNNSGALDLENHTGEVLRWEYSTSGAKPWTVISNTDSRLTYDDLDQTTHFRAVVQSGTCSPKTTGSATITVDSRSVAGTATGSTEICDQESATLTLENYTGTIEWERSADQTGWNTTGKTSATIKTERLTDTTYFRAVVTNGCCRPDTSNVVTVNVNQNSVGGQVETDTICKGTSGTLELTGHTGKILAWEQSPYGDKPWATINHTEANLPYEDASETSYYRVIVQNNGCDTAISSAGAIVVDQPPEDGQITGSATVCSGDNEGEIILNDYEGDIDYWQSSTDNGNSWNDRGSAGKDTISYQDISEETLFRTRISSRFDQCNSIYSEEAKISINQPTLGGTPREAATVCSGDNQDTIHLDNYRGEIIRWEKSSTGENPWDVIAHTTDSLVYKDLNSTTYYRAIVQNNACTEKISDTVKITVNSPSDPGSITGSASYCAQNNEGTLTLTGHNGRVNKWEKAGNTMKWETARTVTPTSLEYENLTDSTFYRVIVKNGVCPKDTSQAASITIHPLPGVNFTADTAKRGYKTHFQNKSSVPAGNLTNFEWDFDNGSGSNARNPVYEYPEAGTYFVSLKAWTDKGCLDSTQNAVKVYSFPNVEFDFNHICSGDTVFFENQTTIPSGNVSYQWDFDDGTTSHKENPSHIYPEHGSYQVQLTTTTDQGVTDSITHTVEVYPHAKPDFAFRNICENRTAKFSNESDLADGAMSFFWDFGDGQTSGALNPEHRYTSHGTYPVMLSTETDHNCKDTIVKEITVNPKPTARFHVDNVPCQTPSKFRDSSAIARGNIEEWIWDFGDGNTSDKQNPDYRYNAPGTYSANLTVVSDSGCSHSTAKDIRIYALPNAKFSAENVCEHDSVYFYNESTLSAGSMSFSWTFDDGSSSQEKNPVHYYSEPGTYQPRLIATSENQGKDTIQKDVTVYPKPDPDFTVPEVCDGHPTEFSNHTSIVSGSVSSYTWDFGDGTNSIQEAPSKQYLNPGSYKVNLTATSDHNCIADTQHTAIVRELPVADFEVNNVCDGEAIQLKNHSSSDEGSVSYYWTLGDGNNSVIEEPTHTYTKPGTYGIDLTATTQYNCVDSLTRHVQIYPLPKVDAGEDTTTSRGFPVKLNGKGARVYDWWPASSLNDPESPEPYARPMETTTYTLRGKDQYGCKNRDSVTVNIKHDHKVIPNNIITPDNNGINDTWKIKNIDAYEKATIHIFNRWGKEVYTKSGYLNEWDGTNSNNDILPDGTYYYVIRFANSDKHYTGSITLLRNKK